MQSLELEGRDEIPASDLPAPSMHSENAEQHPSNWRRGRGAASVIRVAAAVGTFPSCLQSFQSHTLGQPNTLRHDVPWPAVALASVRRNLQLRACHTAQVMAGTGLHKLPFSLHQLRWPSSGGSAFA
mmetsp:Transcript_46531/g.107407  ORF Transcript_46531/g.107407 Transcript_46531/m.107407 type:complete len:127 (+) Transcript_46531:92-472(+)